MGNYFQAEKAVIIACGVLSFFSFLFFFPFFLFWQLDFLDQILSWKFIHLSASPGILFAKMTGMMTMGRLHAKTWATVCKSNLCQPLLRHRKVKISPLPFLMSLRLCCEDVLASLHLALLHEVHAHQIKILKNIVLT